MHYNNLIISSSFIVQNRRIRLVKINHVCFGYLRTTSLLSVLLSISHKKVHCPKSLASIKINVFTSGKSLLVEESIDELFHKDEKEKQCVEFLSPKVI